MKNCNNCKYGIDYGESVAYTYCEKGKRKKAVLKSHTCKDWSERMTKSIFTKHLKTLSFTRQQKRTLRGQALNGDLEGAKKGLEKLTTVKI